MHRRSGGDDTPDETVNDWRDGQHRVRRSRVHAWHGRGYAPTGRKGRRVRRTVRSEARLTADRAGKKGRPSSPTCRRTVLGNRHRRPCFGVLSETIPSAQRTRSTSLRGRRYRETLRHVCKSDLCCEGYGTECSCNDPAPPKGLDTWTSIAFLVAFSCSCTCCHTPRLGDEVRHPGYELE
ncbi:uncharacterized protein SCHCODRAFT_02307859 [Schizophyllum commune H4-8]|uniref:uncharacterized protein n=1 Tax=Schizophyllum commune (strain H4-8 / FGSC 9210) TaxID=578458 RepID=UPI00215DF883|nr:uncharacterized protein SCHCODRAFT_02307859 [Schizophyllum commune H4-8]KAI5890990.1 hypothetical protein SCHCODRAFT_02307859 [Schizophyllum commune H4-8]